ncbi:Hsp20/alpha crystallin family protein [Desulfosediminicola flagellatus]|uniref:Hsp20/alpha crystallin family protein n=1 Tax=Desulfosediminicola flagellatus TaxID=2569541 RepID=UPI0010AB9533|nr:Hsp20/alpha crystallin family protein [Desulfosediminicola flagellatus]
MEFKNLAPWNWFKKKKEQSAARLKQLSVYEEIDQVFDSGLDDHFWSSFSLERPATPLTDPGLLRPYIDISASNTEYLITLDIPGVQRESIELEVSRKTLVIKGEKRQEQEEQQTQFYHIQRSFGSFQRALSLPDDADHENLKVHFKHGRLYITLPRKEKSYSPSEAISN